MFDFGIIMGIGYRKYGDSMMFECLKNKYILIPLESVYRNWNANCEDCNTRELCFKVFIRIVELKNLVNRLYDVIDK